MKAAARILLVAALMTSIGLHWAVMQSVAWVGMAVTYSVKAGSVKQGLSETFDGKHPCRFCHAVEEGTQKSSPDQDHDKSPTKTSNDKVKDLKMDIVSATLPVFFSQNPPAADWVTTSQTGVRRSFSPEPPPPRC